MIYTTSLNLKHSYFLKDAFSSKKEKGIFLVNNIMYFVTSVSVFRCCDFVSGTGAWESALTNTLSPGDRIVSFLIGQFSLLWIDQQQRLNFNVDVVESDWGQGANLDILASKLAEDTAHTIKAICIVHNETATGVTNNLIKVRRILGKCISCSTEFNF